MISTDLKVVTSPDAFLAPTDLKDTLRVIDDDLQTSLVTDYVASAVEYIEQQTRHCFMPKQFLFVLDRWPYFGLPGYAPTGAVQLPRGPLATVDSVKYIDTLGTLQTLDPSTYIVDSVSRPPRIFPARFTFWPIADAVSPNAVQVTFTAGYSDASLIPARAKQAVRFLVAHWFLNRVPVSETAGSEVPFTLASLVRSLKLW